MDGATPSARPLRLVYCDDKGKFLVDPEAVAALHLIKGPIGVVSVGGRAQQGKSFLLNQLLGQSSGFQVESTHRPCTKGLWMWSAPLKRTGCDGTDYSLVLLDTEGIDAYDQTGTCSIQLCSLAVLLSSMFIYNQMGGSGIDEAALDRLSLVTEMTKHIRVRASGGRPTESELGHFSPVFVWLLRDFYLDLAEGNRKITPRDYLELALRPVQGGGRDVSAKNAIRKTIRALFPHRECFTLVRPLNNEKDLQLLDQLPLKSFRPEFRSDLDAFTKFVFDRTEPKQIGVSTMTGPILAGLTQSFLDAINTSVVLTISSSWQYVEETVCQKAYDFAVDIYNSSFDCKKTAEEDALREAHESAMVKAVSVFNASAVGDGLARSKFEKLLRSSRKKTFEQAKKDLQLQTKSETVSFTMPSHDEKKLELLLCEDLRKNIPIIDFYKFDPPNLPRISLHYEFSKSKDTPNGHWKNQLKFPISTSKGHEGSATRYVFYKGPREGSTPTKQYMFCYRLNDPMTDPELVLHTFEFESDIGSVLEHAQMCLEQDKQQVRKEETEVITALQAQLASVTLELKDTLKQLEEKNKLCDEGEQERKKIHNTMLEVKGNIRVFCRVRPLLSTQKCVVHYAKSGMNVGRGVDLIYNGNTHSFVFDKVFDQEAKQEEVFIEISELVQSALDGYKVCIFAYGQTGSGKTHTMVGDADKPEDKGLIPRSFEQIFQTIQHLTSQGWKYKMLASALEIYNDTIHDLIATNCTATQVDGASKLMYKISHDADGNPHVPGLSVVDVGSINDVSSLLMPAIKRRSVGGTQMNKVSSRSHLVFTLRIFAVNEGTGQQVGQQVHGVLNLIDLAGSERLCQSGATGDRLMETRVAINKSLSSLGNVISAIVNKEEHIPFRDSKLTHLLQPCLGGDSKVLMFVNLSPEESSAGESFSALQFADRVNSCELRSLGSPTCPKSSRVPNRRRKIWQARQFSFSLSFLLHFIWSNLKKIQS